MLSLGPPAKSIDAGDYNSFAAALRDRVLAPELNSDIGENSSQAGPRDLTRALAWFLSLDPANSAMNWSQVQQRQLRALKPEVGPAIVNPARWTCFTDWSTALGLSTPGLLDSDRLTPDCTTAVRQVMRASWKPGETVPAVEALHALRDALPVLPGGRYATAVGLASPGDSVAGPALSFALLRGEDEEWLRLQRKADARQSLSIHDPESRSARACSSIVLGRTAMPDFRAYLCWQPAAANGAINTEAVVPSQAVFTATHTPLRIRKAHIRGRSLELMEGKADENAVLTDFMGRDSDTGSLLMPVVGDTGTGKSHLVRWVGMNIPPADRYRVIYLEKSRTSLKAVVETLLDGADRDSGPLAKLKADIGSFSAGLDATALARRIINALNESLAQTTAQEMAGAARALAGTKGLASILQDPYIQEYMLAKGKYIPQLASQLLRDRSEPGSGERPPGFTVDDLPLQVGDENQAAQISRTLLRYLLANPGLRAAAVDLLNQHLEAAVRSAYQLGAGRLYAAMLQVREEYARQGLEIILLIEDFALIQGVQRELLDAITEPAIREGKETIAPIRTLMAVTTGYFTDLPETVMSRVAAATTGYVYDLDVPFSQHDNGTEEIASFAGRYLNAARVGREELDRRGAGNAPNKCEKCDFRDQCHDAFGFTAEGYGLYPFNRPALIRAVHSANSRGSGAKEWAFVPRTALGSVIRPVLIEDSAAISEGNFPDESFRERFPGAPIDRALPNTVAQAVNDNDQTTPEQRKLILEFWGNAPDDARLVDPGILNAFGLEPLPQETEPTRPRRPGGARTWPRTRARTRAR